MHFEYICEGVSQGIMRLNTDHPSETPVIFGVTLLCLNEEQALLPVPGFNGGTESRRRMGPKLLLKWQL